MQPYNYGPTYINYGVATNYDIICIWKIKKQYYTKNKNKIIQRRVLDICLRDKYLL